MSAPTATLLEHEIGPTGLISIRLHSSDVRVRAVDGSVARVHDATGTLERSVRVDRGPGSLSLRADRGLSVSLGSIGSIALGVGRRVPDIEIDVPRHATLVLETASGDVTVDGLAGDQRYRTASGQLLLRDVAGPLTLEVVSGDVELRPTGACTVAARSVSGDLAIRGDVFGSIQVSTTSGDVRIDGRLDGPGPFAIETVSGDTTVAPSGSLRVAVNTVAGDVRSDIATTTDGGRGARVLVIGDGGPTLTVRSISGNVRLVRSTVTPLPLAPLSPTISADPPLAISADPPVPATDADGLRLGILESLERGEIDVAEASHRLEDLDGTAS